MKDIRLILLDKRKGNFCLHRISGETGKLIVIDNADILINDDTRKYISFDDKNQYLIIGRNPKILFATSDNLGELVSEKIGEQTEFRMKEYL